MPGLDVGKLLNMKKLFSEGRGFSLKTFPGATAEHHLLKLHEEVDEAINDPHNIFEYADCMIALFAAVSKSGYSIKDLETAMQTKLDILETRKWQKKPDGTYQHIP